MAFSSSSGSGSATSFASSSDGGNAVSVAKSKKGSKATAKSKADGKGSKAKSVADAKNGADVEAETDVTSKDGAKVSGETVVEGDGPQKTKAKTKLDSDEDVSVSLYIKRVTNGEDVDVVAKELVVVFGGYKNAQLRDAFKTGLSGDEKSVALFTRAIDLFFAGKACGSAIKPVFKGHEADYILYNLPAIVGKCIYTSCAALDNAKYCCGEAQLKNPHCSCDGGKCLWAKPATQNPYTPYWDCKDCGAGVPYCTCY